jgi:hypothetical protein
MHFQELKFHIVDVPNGNHKVSFRHLKQNLISNNTSNDINTINLSSTSLVNVINDTHELIAPNIP